ncbi:MAG: OpgD/OpgG family glucan biosynthesis protein [Halothiobacillus sp.]
MKIQPEPLKNLPSETLPQSEFTRRAFLFSLANLAGLAALGFPEVHAADASVNGAAGGSAATTAPKATGVTAAAAPQVGLSFSAPKQFSYKSLIVKAEEMAKAPYQAPPSPVPDAIKTINYDAAGKINFNPDDALWGNSGSVYPITFRPLGEYFMKSVAMSVVEGDRAREIEYRPEYFSMPTDSPLRQVPAGQSGISGFWLQQSRRLGDWIKNEPWATFQGASYFRAISRQGQVGMSARGIAVNTGLPQGEEFPDFRAFWFEPALNEGDPVVVYALLDGPSITGAYRFELRSDGDTEMVIEKNLFIRKTIDQLGIAPLTSMFWYSETPNSHLRGWRPEVHDSDTLVMWRSDNEHLARPLANPPSLAYSAFIDQHPRGFGLMQRDRDASHYLDGVGYEKRPSAWVEPLVDSKGNGDWGKGSVTLIEIPTNDETFDNVVAFWQVNGPALAGSSLTFKYRLYWTEHEPFFPHGQLARVVALRAGPGGNFGGSRPANTVKLVIEWDSTLFQGHQPKDAVFTVSSSSGKADNMSIDWVAGTPRWLTQFDFFIDSDAPVELNGVLTLDGKVISETWLYQFHRQSFVQMMA